MCAECGMNPCHPRCPNAPEPVPVHECVKCGYGILVGDNPDEEERIMAGLNVAKLLIIDDLGAERSTDYALEKEYGCLCATCEHRHTSFKKCETSCLCCDPDMPLDSFEYDTEAYGGISKCASYSRKKETK